MKTGKLFNATYAGITGSVASLSSTIPTALPLNVNGEGFNVATCSGSWCKQPSSGAGGTRCFSMGDVVAAALCGVVAGMLLYACLARGLRVHFRKADGPDVSARGSDSSLRLDNSSRGLSEDTAHSCSYELHVDDSSK